MASDARAVRSVWSGPFWLMGFLASLLGLPAASAEPPPTLYELMINGESFLVESNRLVTLESKRQPGVKYQVALRVAPVQRVRLRSCQFEYALPAKLHEPISSADGSAPRQSARVTHELGFDLLVNDLGGPLKPGTQAEALRILSESVKAAYQQMSVRELKAAAPHQRRFAHCQAHGVVIHYLDEQGLGHTSLVYVLGDESFAATCVVQYLDKDGDDVLPLIKKTLDSIRPLD